MQEGLRGVGVDVVLIAEKTLDAVTPDFAQLHAFVIVVEVARGVDVFGHPRTRIPDHRLDAVAELPPLCAPAQAIPLPPPCQSSGGGAY